MNYNSIRQSMNLRSIDISQARAKQRAGRAGRIRNGYCYRLYSLEQYESMEKHTMPEILRAPLTEICLNAKILSNDLSIEEFLLKAIQPPSIKNIRQSIELLKKIDVLDNNENITYLGVHLAHMPMDCQLGKMILYSIMLRCLDPIVTIVCALSLDDPFILPAMDYERANLKEIKKDFAQNSLSDHRMLLNIFNEWSKSEDQIEFCTKNYISHNNMRMIQRVRRQIMNHLRMAKYLDQNNDQNLEALNENSQKWEVVKACLTAGLYPNICRISLDGQIFSKQDRNLAPQLRSILRDRKARGQIDPNVINAKAEWLIYGEKSQFFRWHLISNITVVPAIDVALFTGPINLPESALTSSDKSKSGNSSKNMDSDNLLENTFDIRMLKNDFKNKLLKHDMDCCETKINIDELISFIIDDTDAKFLLKLRQKFAAMFVRFLRNPVTFQMTNNELNMLKILVEVIRHEDNIEIFLRRN